MQYIFYPKSRDRTKLTGMGTKHKKRSKHRDDSSVSPSSSGSDESERSSKRRSRKDRDRGDESSKRDREKRRRRRREKEERERERKRRKRRREGKKKRDDSESSDASDSGSDDSEPERPPKLEPEAVLRDMLAVFPNVGDDLKQLLQMLDDGQAVDIKGISEKSLSKHLKKLFISLKLKESGDRVFMLSSKSRPTLEVVGPLIYNCAKPKEQQVDDSILVEDTNSVKQDAECGQAIAEDDLPLPGPKEAAAVPPPRRVIGPAMPSAELLAAAAKLTEAQAELRDADLEEDTETFIGPPPPAMVIEAESANEAERFEEVTRIMAAEADSPYDVLGVNHKMATDNVKKRYWKLSLLVHPDKCPHPQANEAFIKLNKSFKDLQDPEKRKALDDKIKVKEEQEAFKAELKSMREAAQWRRIQGISMEGDDELLADMEVKVAPQRDEWMTSLPPERKAGGMPKHSTSFSKSTKEGRGDTSNWTDTPSDRAQKAKMQYLEAYNQATALASNEEENKRQSSDADLVDKYNKAKRSKSLVEKHQEERVGKSSKKKSKQKVENDEWKGQHPWKPWDREKDLTAGRQNVKLDPENMGQGLTSRFSSANIQRNFL